MLPIYEAIQFLSVIPESSGHTKPWVVLANTPEGLTPFVVKLYDSTQVDEQHRVCNEIVGNLLAKEFELKAPDCALLNIPDELVVTLPPEVQQQFDNADSRLKFATTQLSGVNNAVISLGKKHFEDRIALDTLYAFDNLIRNCDRGAPKANLLLSSDDAFLIDHEHTFSSTDVTNINLENLQIDQRFTNTHLFYHFLKKSKPATKQNFFKDFTYYLENLNINMLNPYFNQLSNEGFNDYSEPILTWLNLVKQKKTIFVNNLKGTVL